MSLFENLQQIGYKLKIIQTAPVTKKDPPKKIPTRTISLRDLTTEVQAESVRALAERPAELSVDFAKVFEAAGIKPAPHGWTIERLHQVLQTDPCKGLDRPAVQKAILELLTADKAAVEDLVKDAIARDQALDAYEAVVRKKMAERAQVRDRRVDELESQIQALQRERDKLKGETQSEDEQMAQWKQKKLDCEKDMARAIGYLFEKPVVTID